MRSKMLLTATGLVGTLLLAGAVWADKPATVPRTGGILACEADLAEATTSLGACTADLGTCTGDLGTCTGDLTTCSGDLGTCTTDLAAANASLTTCTGDLATCTGDLAACEASQAVFPGDGAGSGPALAYTDNGDGTITDGNTKLMWEQKVAGGAGSATCLTAPHGVDSSCTWAQATDGATTSGWLHVLNNTCEDDIDEDCSANGDDDCTTGVCGYAGYRDWRLPNVKELQSIVDYSTLAPSIAGVFGSTASSFYWSATSVAFVPNVAWLVFFGFGSVDFVVKDFAFPVRAVRSSP